MSDPVYTAGSGQLPLVLRPGGSPGGNVFTSWDALAATARTLVERGGSFRVQFDTTNAPGDGNCHVTAGAWQIGPDCSFLGSIEQAIAGQGLVFDDGATLDFWPARIVDLRFRSDSTAAVAVGPNPLTGDVYYFEGATNGSATVTPALTSTGLVFALLTVATEFDNGGAPLIDADTMAVLLDDITNLQPNALSSTSVMEILAASPAATFSVTQAGPGFILVGYGGSNDYAAAGGSITSPGAGPANGSWADSNGSAAGNFSAHADSTGSSTGQGSHANSGGQTSGAGSFACAGGNDGGNANTMALGSPAALLSCFGATPPVGQQPGGAAVAGPAYTATEQGMLNRAYQALRAYGLLA